MKYALRITGPVERVLSVLLADPAVPRYGLEISKQADLETGTLYPIMARLERVRWVESRWEDPDLSITDGRPRRRYYQLTRDGAESASRALQDLAQARHKRRSSLAAAQPGVIGVPL